jgi:hypothetical protein
VSLGFIRTRSTIGRSSCWTAPRAFLRPAAFSWPICRYRTSTPAFARAGSAPRWPRPRPSLRHRRFLGAGLHLSLLSHFRGPPQTSRSREPGPLWFRLQAPRAPPVFVFARSAPNEREGSSLGLEHLVSRHSMPGMLHPWARSGSRRFPGDPSYASALLQDPGRADKTSPLAVLPTPPPAYPNRRPQRVHNLEANTGLQHPLSTLHERRRRLPCKTRFRLAGCASTGRGSNPLDRCERFQVTFPFSFPGLLLSQG